VGTYLGDRYCVKESLESRLYPIDLARISMALSTPPENRLGLFEHEHYFDGELY